MTFTRDKMARTAKLGRLALDEIAAPQRAADDKRKLKLDGVRQAGLVPPAVIIQ